MAESYVHVCEARLTSCRSESDACMIAVKRVFLNVVVDGSDDDGCTWAPPILYHTIGEACVYHVFSLILR